MHDRGTTSRPFTLATSSLLKRRHTRAPGRGKWVAHREAMTDISCCPEFSKVGVLVLPVRAETAQPSLGLLVPPSCANVRTELHRMRCSRPYAFAHQRRALFRGHAATINVRVACSQKTHAPLRSQTPRANWRVGAHFDCATTSTAPRVRIRQDPANTTSTCESKRLLLEIAPSCQVEI